MGGRWNDFVINRKAFADKSTCEVDHAALAGYPKL